MRNKLDIQNKNDRIHPYFGKEKREKRERKREKSIEPQPKLCCTHAPHDNIKDVDALPTSHLKAVFYHQMPSHDECGGHPLDSMCKTHTTTFFLLIFYIY